MIERKKRTGELEDDYGKRDGRAGDACEGGGSTDHRPLSTNLVSAEQVRSRRNSAHDTRQDASLSERQRPAFSVHPARLEDKAAGISGVQDFDAEARDATRESADSERGDEDAGREFEAVESEESARSRDHSTSKGSAPKSDGRQSSLED